MPLRIPAAKPRDQRHVLLTCEVREQAPILGDIPDAVGPGLVIEIRQRPVIQLHHAPIQGPGAAA